MASLTDFEKSQVRTTFANNALGNKVSAAVDATTVVTTNSPVAATITVATSQTSPRAISIQLKDAAGVNLAASAVVDLYVLAGTTGSTLATTGGSTGIAIGASGSLVAITAKKIFRAVSDAAGVIALTWTDNAGETAYLGVVLGNGTIVRSANLQTA